MDHNQLPHLEILTQQTSNHSRSQTAPIWYTARRFKIFLVSFLICSLIGLIYVFQRPAIYQSKTTLLTVSPAAVDQPNQEASVQHVSIQGSILTGLPLIEVTRDKLFELTSKEIPLTADMRDMLFVVPVEETNLIELQAEGEDANFLPLLLNTLTEQYQLYRRQKISQETDETALALSEQFKTLTDKVAEKRDELDQFRNRHSILSMGRDENQVLARLKGLTDSLNKANDAEVNAKAHLNAVQSSIRKGQPVVPNSDERSLANMEKRAQELREQLSELDRRFTREYLALQPSLRVIPEQLAKIEKKIANMKNEGQSIVLTDAEQAYYAAHQASTELKQQIEDYKQTATEFTRRFAEHEALVEELSQLELLYRETQERLIQIEIQQREKYPQVNIVEAAYRSSHPVRPNYARDSGIALLFSLFFGLAVIWLFEFLKRDEEPSQPATASWSRVFTGIPSNPLIEIESSDRLEHSQQGAIENRTIPKLSSADIEQLLEVSNKQGKLVISALLSGLTIDELSILSADQIDFSAHQLKITDPDSRTITLSPSLAKYLAELTNIPNNLAEAEALITCAAFDSGLANPSAINAFTIRETYIMYLVHQGLRLGELEKIIGSIPAEELAGYAPYSPDGPGKKIDEVNCTYPIST
ncbi:MAG: integrase [Gammaproteobacteria bacterium]|nr:MAG: integrase [Gammaproteobacteria bacterium]